MDIYPIKTCRTPTISLLIASLVLCGTSILFVGCDHPKKSPSETNFIEFDGVRHPITSYNVKGGFNSTLNQREIKLELLQEKNTIGTLSLGLEGNPIRVGRAGVCIVYGNGVFELGEKKGALCVSGLSVVSSVKLDKKNPGTPKLEFKWSGNLGKENVPARVEFSSTAIDSLL
jgi:hypothetical protein